MKATLLLAFLAAVLALTLPAANARADSGGCGAEECVGDMPVVPSLDPQWSASFVPPPVSKTLAPLACISTDIVVYAPTDWVRFAQKMRANMSSCASYYVSIPPIVADKTKPRGPVQATLIRGLGPNFHAVNEINVTDDGSWKDWVTGQPGRTWYDAGVEARLRMDDPLQGNFDPSSGDLWALNELTTPIRQGNPVTRQNMRDFVHGLYDGPAGAVKVKGIVWDSNFGQGTVNFDTYKFNLKKWFRDDPAWWDDMSKYVRFFSQEVYGRVDRWAVPGTTPQDRLGPTADYVEHFANLAAAGAYETGDAASYVAAADAPVANAAWSSTTYEWPSPPVDYLLAANFDVAQVYAFRYAQDGRANQAFGFAWSPTDPKATPIPGFSTKTGVILDRIAAAIHATDAPSDTPGLAACQPDLSWCTGDLPGATLNPGWSIFHDWTQPVAQPSSVTVQEDETTPVALKATDPDPGQQLTFSIVDQPLHGTVTTDGSASATYVPAAGYYGPDSFTFRTFDGWMNSNVATVTILVNAPPVPDAGSDLTGQWGVPLDFHGTATDPDGDALKASWSFGDGSTADGFDASHAYADPGTYTATLSVSDANGGSASDSTTVVVGPRPSTLLALTQPTLDAASADVSARLDDAAPAPRLAGHMVVFVGGGATCTAKTDATGTASCALGTPALGPSAVKASFDGDALYTTSSVTSATVVYRLLDDAWFAVGDRSATGDAVFWGPSWWKANEVSGGTAPASFKGFLQGDGTATPGLSHAAPAVPDWMGVAVVDRVVKNGDAITAHVAGHVVVHVEDYDPAQTGHGAVVARID